jgi:hypothetical protein
MKAGRLLLVGVPLLTCCIGLHGQSDPLKEWEVMARSPMELRGLAYKDGTFVGVAFGTNIVVSTNAGIDWFLLPINLPDYRGAMAVTEGDGQFVAVGWSGNILTSRDGLQWMRGRGGAQTPYEEFWAVTYGGGQFVAVGFQGYTNPATIAATSADGIHWEKFTIPFDTTPRNVAYGNGLYVAAGAPVSMYSSNGRDWTPLSGVLAQGIAYGSGQFIATTSTTQGGYRSSNGVNWTEIPLPGLESVNQNYYGNYFTAAYANGMFIIGGFCDECPNTNRPSLLATSTDGVHWTSRVFGAKENIGPIRDIVFVDGAFYLADSWFGKIWKSGRTPPTSRPAIIQVSRSGGRTSLSFTTVAGFHYRVESTEDWGSTSWEPCLGPFFATGDQLTVGDSTSPNDLRFYRVRSE